MDQPVPKYYKIYEKLISDIREGVYHEGDLFPSDTELVKDFEVSRGTVREAVKLLFQQGYLIRQQGKGTFLSYKRIEQNPDKLIGFTELMRKHNLKPSARVIKKEIVVPSANISHLMKINPGDEVVRLIRLRFGDSRPLIIERSFFNLNLFKPIFDMDLETNSIFELLHTNSVTQLGNALQRIEAFSAGKEENQWLGVELQTPLLLIKRLIKTKNNVIFQYSEDVYRSDRINFTTQTVPYEPDRGLSSLPLNLTEKDWI